MENVKIITDSASDLPKELVEQYDIDVLPLAVIENSMQYKEGVSITPEEVFKKMREGTTFTTSQVTSHDYYLKFEEYILKDRPCIYIAFSSELSGCYQASILAKNQLIQEYGEEKCKVIIVDTKCASLGFGLIVLRAAEEAKKGKSLDEIRDIVIEKSLKMGQVFTVFDLNYLHKGGRLKKSAAILGNLLNVYPILHVEEGSLKLLETARGRKKLYKRMFEIIKDTGYDLKNQTVGIIHGDNVEVVDELKDIFNEKFQTSKFITRSVGAVIGAHTGPELIALFYDKK